MLENCIRYIERGWKVIVPMDEEAKHIIENSDKLIKIILDGKPEDYTATSYKDLMLALARKDKFIVTPLTWAIDNGLTLDGYRVEIYSERKMLCLNDMLLGKGLNENDKELRLSHNAEKLILSGVYDIETSWQTI